MSEWIRVEDRLPEDDGTVLAVKQLKDGSRQICLAYCNLDWMYRDPVSGVTRHEPRWVCGGNNNIIWWQPLPEMPEEGKHEQDHQLGRDRAGHDRVSGDQTEIRLPAL